MKMKVYNAAVRGLTYVPLHQLPLIYVLLNTTDLHPPIPFFQRFFRNHIHQK